MKATIEDANAEYNKVCGGFSDEDFGNMSREAIANPELIFDTMRGMTVLCYIMFAAGDTKGSDVMRDAIHRSAMVLAVARKRKEADNETR